jgi:hypothetical protein
MARDAKLVLTGHATRRDRRTVFRSVPSNAKCARKANDKWSFEFQIFSDKLTALTTVLGFLGFCVPPLTPFYALEFNQSSVQLQSSQRRSCDGRFDSSNELDPNADPYSYFQTSQQRYGTCQLNLLQPNAWYFCCQLVRYKVDKFPHFLHFFSSCAHIHFTRLNF